ncbi:glucuronyl esterase domain-containing protein [Mucilaginibacter aquaedulcis]|uniref:glucuronyl esterase domain-containing protein n=1 Tax=Mucilaginibacter aquaedulcis TaxID=1187081 RepID=UPI0025B5EB0E|nr:prolyl oligopeptidase family serine peptidase [Mucilaginibacter aquaedulcis]MDN3546731.1 prolyl oligopeptidase family serine peptidase [Mucilaginibacter aquaedulcis]
MLKQLIGIILIIAFAAKVSAQNYDETKVPAFTLPDILKTTDGRTVKTIEAWEQSRRPEILRMFEENVYGTMPKTYDRITFKITAEDKNAMGGKAHLKEVTVTIYNSNTSVNIHLTLFTPNNGKTSNPAFLFINNRDTTNTDPTRKVKSDFWPAEMVIDSGYAIAAFNVNDAAPDNKDNYTNGVLKLYPDQLNADKGMKAIGCWAWAASRVMDYLKTDKDIDFTKVSIVGHSRGGKATLWAAAEDERFAMVFANCSGNTGAALARRQFGETVKIINTHYPYWFNNNYKNYNDAINSLPVDQHMLIALMAPRPVYTTNATKDLWADPLGSYLSVYYAQKAYELYGINPELKFTPPPANSPIINQTIGYHIREGIHDLTLYDWSNFIRFANIQYSRLVANK